MKKIKIIFEVKYFECDFDIPEKMKEAIEEAIRNSYKLRRIEIPMIALEYEHKED